MTIYTCVVAVDTSRCAAEKKYTEQQAKKLFPQVFVPVCNPDGTYSEVSERTESKLHKHSHEKLCLKKKERKKSDVRNKTMVYRKSDLRIEPSLWYNNCSYYK